MVKRSARRVSKASLTRRDECGLKAQLIKEKIKNLSDFFAVFHSVLKADELFWFRGHSDLAYTLKPSALRYDTEEDRQRALSLIDDMKRSLEIKLARPPPSEAAMKWMQIAQHYGLPTRLLDWTQSAVVALYFACDGSKEKNGAVIAVNPLDLNRLVDPQIQRPFNDDLDRKRLDEYAKLDGRVDKNGCLTIAVSPTWNNERIVLQQGSFTLHGSRAFELTSAQATSLTYVTILSEHKEALRRELERAGISRMFIFPEPEHLCRHLLWKHGLDKKA